MSTDDWRSWARPQPAPRRRQPFLTALGLLLLIYATLARAGAHLGIPLTLSTGIYIGDLVLLTGLAILAIDGIYWHWFSFPSVIAWLWTAFFIWNAAQTIPYLSKYGMLALRDGAVWGYSLFAVIVYSQLMSCPDRFLILLRQFSRFAHYYLFWIPLAAPLALFFPTPLFAEQQLAELMPHVVGSLAFVVCRLVAVPAIWWWLLPIDILICGTQMRGSFVAFVAAAAVLVLSKPYRLRINARTIGWSAGLGLIFVTATILNLGLAGGYGRTLSPRQFLENIEGIFERTGDPVLDDSRRTRQELWDKIIDYTVHGPYFWTGKGYGINIYADAGFQVGGGPDYPEARSPENAEINFLARSGVPGFLLWIGLQAAWVMSLLRIHAFARRTGRPQTAGIMAFLLTYWTGFMIYAVTSVIFEGPQGGIWFWTIFGVGAAAARIVRRDPDFFERIDFSAFAAASKRRAVA